MRFRLLCFPLLALLASGCERMPEDPVFIYGRLLNADGSPRANTPLRVERSSKSPSYTGYPVGGEVVDLGYRPYSEGTSEAAGYFTLETLAGDITTENAYVYEQYRFRVFPPLEADGHGVFAAFSFRDDVELPLLRTWDSGFTVSDGAQGPTLTFAAAPPVPETPPSGEVPTIWDGNTSEPRPAPPTTPEPVLHLHGPDGLLWEQFRATSPWVVSPYVLEDFTGPEAQLRAVSTGLWFFYPLGADGSDLDFRVEWRTPRKPLPPGALRPVSRGAACGPVHTPGPCPYTDGKLAIQNTVPPSTQPGASPVGLESLTFTLDRAVLPRRVVVRGLKPLFTPRQQARVILEGSENGDTYEPLADVPVVLPNPYDPWGHYVGLTAGTEADSPFDPPLDPYRTTLFLDAPLTASKPVRFVRLRVMQDGNSPLWMEKLAEVSVFE
ncbi:hypothetical protein HPC49_02025 [Pyxidicoccus fallax]|uniref:Lipoprotein n=1 Tax=Pyxidicoccus fallax TaxID=394095 RepID=A0A848LAS2_9BACT|nr:hypothetical protein [Pyxidicoccus fallax]NMO13783.1 hypothetical protein [Pyxidicoccus fallax]NPC77030.1 hypothetical protein [Pyxidicoccus fallax]